jgi:hypothetical protein
MARSIFGDLTIDVEDGPPGILRLDWRGKSNHRQPDVLLAPFFADVMTRAVTQQRAIEMHFEQLEFFNSSTITVIIQHVKDLRDRKVKLTVTFDSRHRWQKIFFDALFIFDKGDGLFTIKSAPTSRGTPVGT